MISYIMAKISGVITDDIRAIFCCAFLRGSTEEKANVMNLDTHLVRLGLVCGLVVDLARFLCGVGAAGFGRCGECRVRRFRK